MSALSPFLQILAATGRYAGEGITLNRQKFHADFSIEPMPGGKTARISFRATGQDGTVFHDEVSVLTPTPDDKLMLQDRVFIKRQAELGAKEGFVFRLNNSAEHDVLREEICLSLYANGDLGYRYSRGLPGKEFGFYSSVRLKPVVTV